MKKQKRKLVLAKETLKPLTDREGDLVHGETGVPSACYTDCDSLGPCNTTIYE
jgi:hypothetical protein